MEQYENKFKTFLKENNIIAEYFSFKESCHSVEEAVQATNASPLDFIKNICLIDNKGNLIVAIVKGEDRVSTTKVGKALNIERPRPATLEEILEKTGYPCGGVPPFGYPAIFLIDSRVLERDSVFTG
jgi:Cys-tRNA(Pro)/Cys-tRNA(Cys) deacylase